MNTTLYPGIAFSPQAELTDNIGAADTIIPVSDAAAFPEAPNLATIGTDEEGETILYTAKTANALSGCRRGVEGTAKSWQAGEPIGRNFTAKDHADLIAEVREAAKTAEAGGVTFDDGETFQEKYDSGELVGPVGKTGAPGKDGPQGPTGKSAYQYAVDGGYTGTEAQFQALLNDIPNKQPKLTGTPGQAVGFGADGAAVAVAGWSNPNLLINWYFADPVNQRGQKTYTNDGYTIDKWYVAQRDYGTSVIVDDIGVTFRVTSKGTNKNGAFVYQTLPSLKAGTYTYSVLVSQLNGSGVMGVDRDEAPWGVLSQEIPLKPGLNTVTFTIANDVGRIGIFLAKRVLDIVSFKFVAAKLELGSHQTLAHKDASGNWVLNDPPPDKTLEMLKCQRYYQVFSSADMRPVKAVDFRPPMRVDPAFSTIEINGVTYYTADANL